ncbi:MULTISPECIES: ABC transporter permease [Dickeya]|uniref:ABC transporter permease n=1 Tax=Dickeya TaxID=204037 RepID=UPI001CE5A5EA|nr:ABC transporter permease [Dickeya zeae]QYM97248.1 ABC transporter permease [Dickeya zeae]UPT57293.1 ABC transporter permease [Dickeya zeae]
MKNFKSTDLYHALRQYDLWVFLAWQDIKLRYRRSRIGPFWITISMSIFIVVLGVVYSKLFKTETRDYLPYLSVGYVAWGFFAGVLGDFSNIFVEHANYMRDIKMNPFVILFRVLFRYIIIFLHNIVIIFGVYIYFAINPGLPFFLAIPGFLLIVCNFAAIGVILGIAGVRFRDIAQISQNMIQILFFVTPVIWMPRLVSENSWIVLVNPFKYYIDLIREPLLGKIPGIEAWCVSFSTFIVFALIAAVVYKYKSSRIPFWL